MKRIVVIFSVLVCFYLGNAQSLVVTGDTYFTGLPIDQITHHLDVKNTANKGITVVCQKTYLSSPATLPTWAGASYCFAGNCYSSSSTNPSSTALLGAGQTFSYANNDLDAFSGYYDPASTPGITTVEYCFYDEINPSDNTCVVITYDVSSASRVDDINSKIGHFYPNPTKEIVYFDYNINKPVDLIIMDILGNKVSSRNLLGDGIQKLDISEFAKGIYFGNLIIDNEVLLIEKIIVR